MTPTAEDTTENRIYAAANLVEVENLREAAIVGAICQGLLRRAAGDKVDIKTAFKEEVLVVWNEWVSKGCGPISIFMPQMVAPWPLPSDDEITTLVERFNKAFSLT